MLRSVSTWIRPAFFAAGLLSIACLGCGQKDMPEVAEGRTMPRGRVLENGVPIKTPDSANLPPGDPGFTVTFIKLGTADAGSETTALVNEDEPGSFELIGDDGKGIVPGNYRVAIFVGPEGGQDALKGKFSKENSRIEVEVKEGEDLVIDLAKYE
jgi:hypothetical protein